MYEQIRPLLLFGETAGERAKETGAAQRTLSRKADEFERYGMQSLFSSGEQGGERETSKTLPPEIRQLIVDLHAELPTMLGQRNRRDLLPSLRQKARPSQCQTYCNLRLPANFFKTELELGHCLRLPQEGPCKCDLYLSCAKFVTTPEYAPRLRRRRKRELELIEDARNRDWQREVERHQCTVGRIEHLLADLGELIDGLEATD